MPIAELKSNNTIVFPVDESNVEYWPKHTAADKIRKGDLLEFNTDGVEVIDGASPDNALFVGVAMDASEDEESQQYLPVATKCVLKVLMDASGVVYPGKALTTSSGSSTANWIWTESRIEGLGYSRERILGSVYGTILIHRDLLTTNTIRETVTS